MICFRKSMVHISAIFYLSGSIFSGQLLAGDYAENVAAQEFFEEILESTYELEIKVGYVIKWFAVRIEPD